MKVKYSEKNIQKGKKFEVNIGVEDVEEKLSWWRRFFNLFKCLC